MSRFIPISSYTKYPSYNFNGKVPDDMSAEHSWIQSQAPMLKELATEKFVIINGNPVQIPLFFETNDLLQTNADLANVLEIYGDDSRSIAPFTQKRSGLLTTVDTPNRITIQNQRDITSYVVGDQTIYNTEFNTIQDAVNQAVMDGVNSSANPRREVFIIIRPGVYPDSFTIPRHGIHLIGMTSGVTKDVTISGNVIIAPLDSPGKTNMLLRGLHIAGTLDINTPLVFNPKVFFDDCLLEGLITINASLQTIELTLSRTLIQTTINITGRSVTMELFNNCTASTINIDLTTLFSLTANTSSFNVYMTGTTIIPTITIRAFLCFFGLSLANIPGVTSYLAQNVVFQIIACQLGVTTVYGSFDPANSIIAHSNISFLELGDPNPMNVDDHYIYGTNAGATIVTQPFLISHCVFGEVRLNMKSDIVNTPQSVTFDQCTFNIESNRTMASFRINDLSTTVQGTSPQTVNVTNCSIIGATSINLDLIGNPLNGGANLFILFAQCIFNISNIIFSSGGPTYACIVGGSSVGLPPTNVTILQNVFTLNDNANFVVNGTNSTGINLTYLDGVGVSFGNIITNTGALSFNILTGTVGVVNQGFSF